jgi:hypothetical protein
LTPAAERELTQWMRLHLEVAVHTFAAADALADLEWRVLRELDPPMNLEGMETTTLRLALSLCRRALSAG